MNHPLRLLLAAALALGCAPETTILPNGLRSIADAAVTTGDAPQTEGIVPVADTMGDVLAADVPNADVVVLDGVAWITDRPEADVPPVDTDAGGVTVADAGTDAPTADAGAPADATDGGGAADVPTVDVPAACGALEARCGGVCVNVALDVANCGACGRVCPALAHETASCNGGGCVRQCVAYYGDCGRGCQDLRNDSANCGMCGRGCGDAAVCSDGQCLACPSGQTACDGRCQRLDTAEHCGSCGRRCDPGAACTGGSCAYLRCSATPTAAGTWRMCFGECVNFDSDNRHCGACGTVCPAATQCGGIGCR